MSERVKLPDSTQLDTLNGKLESINTTLAGQEFVTKDNIVSALGYEPVKPEGNYELIGTFNSGTEDVKSWSVYKDDDGNYYKLTSIRCVIQPNSELSADRGCSCYLCVNNGKQNVTNMYQFASRNLTQKYEAVMFGTIVGNRVATMHTTNYSTSGSPDYSRFTTFYSDEDIWFSGFMLYSGNLIPANTTVTIYGIRA